MTIGRQGPDGQPWVVAIDGAAGSGKSTLSRGLAGRLDLPYVNTGAMYRALAASSIRASASPDDPSALVELAEGLRFILRVDPPGSIEVEGYDEEDLTTLEVEGRVSAVARHGDVRARMRAAQRDLGDAHGAVMEGRDIGSVVFPDAPVKLFLVADSAQREERRIVQRRNLEATAIIDALRDRDERDAQTNPFEPAVGATVIDTTHLGVEETIEVGARIVATTAAWMLP